MKNCLMISALILAFFAVMASMSVETFVLLSPYVCFALGACFVGKAFMMIFAGQKTVKVLAVSFAAFGLFMLPIHMSPYAFHVLKAGEQCVCPSDASLNDCRC